MIGYLQTDGRPRCHKRLSIPGTKGVRDAVWCGFGQFLASYFAVRFS